MKSLVPLFIRRHLGGACDCWRAGHAKRRLLRSLRGGAVTCNVCLWTGARFTDDPWHVGTICPNCRSQVRHRLLVAALDGRAGDDLREAAVIAGRAVLHFAPERHFSGRLREGAGRYVTADHSRGDCDLQLDISAMSTVDDASFDTVIACDVLEHVPNDRAAFREIHRILRPGGTAILTVPQRDPPADTDENPCVTSEAARTERFGQKDHVRMYGDDFVRRFEDAGFAVTTIHAACFAPDLVARHVLQPPLRSPHPLATNERRIYFGRKA